MKWSIDYVIFGQILFIYSFFCDFSLNVLKYFVFIIKATKYFSTFHPFFEVNFET